MVAELYLIAPAGAEAAPLAATLKRVLATADIAALGRDLRRDGIAVSTVGLGDDYNEDLMTALAEASNANYYYVRDAEHLVRVMSTSPSYLRGADDGQVKNLRDWGIPLGRRFRALKLWFLIREQGVRGLQERLRRDLANARWLEAQVRGTPGWEVVAPVHLQTVCVRHTPPELTEEALDRHTLAWADRVNRSGAAYLTPAVLDGRWVVRISIGGERKERAHVEALWNTVRQAAEEGAAS